MEKIIIKDFLFTIGTILVIVGGLTMPSPMPGAAVLMMIGYLIAAFPQVFLR